MLGVRAQRGRDALDDEAPWAGRGATVGVDEVTTSAEACEPSTPSPAEPRAALETRPKAEWNRVVASHAGAAA